MNIHSISSRLLIWFSIVSLIPLIAVSVILLDLFTQRQVDSVNTYLSQVADMKENQINAYIDERLMDVRILSQSSGAIQSIEKLTNAYQKFGVKNPEYLKIEAEVRANYTPMLENYYDLFFIS
ncbi:MAG: hypothetical protein OEL79_07585, partial [Chromatiales bacterium]|nr:hypothetical protein [Chromatiales bacterium]